MFVMLPINKKRVSRLISHVPGLNAHSTRRLYMSMKLTMTSSAPYRLIEKEMLMALMASPWLEEK